PALRDALPQRAFRRTLPPLPRPGGAGPVLVGGGRPGQPRAPLPTGPGPRPRPARPPRGPDPAGPGPRRTLAVALRLGRRPELRALPFTHPARGQLLGLRLLVLLAQGERPGEARRAVRAGVPGHPEGQPGRLHGLHPPAVHPPRTLV